MLDNLPDLRIGDLIHVPEVETVIDLAEVRDLDPDDPQNRVALENLGHSFVITDDIRSILTIVFGYLQRKQGQGFFVIGNYGAGKSHLLGILGLTARYIWAQKALESKFGTLYSNKAERYHKYLPVLVPLTEYAADKPLEEIILESAENAAATAGIPLTLSSTRRTIETFNRYVLKEHETEFRDYINKRFGDITWEQIHRDDPASAHTIINQFSEHSKLKIPVASNTDRKKLLNELIQSITAGGWEGVFFIIDELSEFLKSKPVVQMLHEDTRFLQFLGESVKSHPVWVIAAVQESLDMNQSISTNVFRKIKERYQHMKLSTGHLQQFISERLLPRNDDHSIKCIEQIYNDLHNAFAGIPIKKADFIALYPIHPETLEILNLNIDLFSRHRGLVDFLSTRIRGKPETLITGILDQPCHTLLTPDVIFDHFQDQLAESDKHFVYYHLYKNHFLPVAQYRFENQNDCVTALKTIKILILLAITPLNHKRTVKELANMILYRVFETGIVTDEANYEWFEEHILRKLYQKVGHLKRIPGKHVLDDVYQISVDGDPISGIDNRLDRIKSNLAPNDKATFTLLIQSMSTGILPLATCLDKVSIRDSVIWQNTRRRIAVKVASSSELECGFLQELKKTLSTGKIDFALIPVFPETNPNTLLIIQKFLTVESQITVSGAGFILPKIPDSKSFNDAMLEIQACKIMISDVLSDPDNDDATPILDKLNIRLDNSIAAASEELQKAYLEGTLILSTGQYKMPDHTQCDHFDKWLGLVLKPALNNRFPEHITVAPEIDCQSKIIQELLLDKFIRPGNSIHLIPGKDDLTLDAIEKIARPLGLATKKGGVWHLAGNPTKSKAAKSVMEQLPGKTQNDSVSAGRALMNSAKPPLGMSRPVFELALLTLVRKGYITPLKSGKILNLYDLNLPLTGKIDTLQRGELISDQYRPAFFRLYKLVYNRALNDIDLDIQDVLWKKIQPLFQSWKNTAEQFCELVTTWNNQFSSCANNLTDTYRILKHAESLVLTLEQENLNTIQRWHSVLHQFDAIENPDALFSAMKQMKGFVDKGYESLTSVRSYISKLQSMIPDDPQYSVLKSLFELLSNNVGLTDDIVIENELAVVLKQFDTFRVKYKQQYLKEHETQSNKLKHFDSGKITSSVEYRVLQRMNDIHFLKHIAELHDYNESIKQINHLICHHNPETALDIFPVCSCGFKLGTVFTTVSAETWKERFQKRIFRAFSVLQTQAFLLTPETVAHDMKIPEQQVQALNEIMSLDTRHSTLVSSLDTLLTADMIGMINRLADIKTPDMVVSFEDMFCEFNGCTMTARDVRKKFRALLKRFNNCNDDEWIRFDT